MLKFVVSWSLMFDVVNILLYIAMAFDYFWMIQLHLNTWAALDNNDFKRERERERERECVIEEI